MRFFRTLRFAIMLMTCWALGVPQSSLQAEVRVNQLTPPEQSSGWSLLFDGEGFDGWRNYRGEGVSDGWKVIDGAMVRQEKGAGDLITEKQYEFFELSLEYKISEGGNSGLMFRVTEDEKKPSMTGPEVQIQDSENGHDEQKAGWLYGLYQPTKSRRGRKEPQADSARPSGQWNRLYLRVAPTGGEVCLNGYRYFQFQIGSKDWDKKVAASKFAKFKGFGKASKGHLCLQDHGDLVSFRSIKIREIEPDSPSPQPITGKLDLGLTNAFPSLEWDQWEPTDDSGKVAPLRLVELTYPKDDSNRLFAISQRGQIWCFDNDPDVKESHLFLDLTEQVSDFRERGANEQGLLGLAFHPDFKHNGRLFTYYTQVETHKAIISQWTVSDDDPNRANSESEAMVLSVDQPFQNHNGGSIEFGPDGFLYAGIGDGGYFRDPYSNGQNLGSLLGSIVRLDVDRPLGDQVYSPAAGNPFLNVDGARPEIYAYGLRNPWRLAFDPDGGRLWSADVGQDLMEEVNIIERGGNYGWALREGSQTFGKFSTTPRDEPIDPVWEYDHQVGKSITGGRVYRGKSLPQLTGKYIYADYVTGSVWALTYDDAEKKTTANEQVVSESVPVLAFGQDPEGEVYLLSTSAKGHSIQKFVPGDPSEEVGGKSQAE